MRFKETSIPPCRAGPPAHVHMTNFHLTYNHMQGIWNKLEKSSKTGQGKKSLMSTFACFLTATAKV